MESVARFSPPPLLFSSTLTEYWTVGNYCISLNQLQQRRTAPTETERTDERRLLAAAGEDGVDEQEGQKGVAPGAGGLCSVLSVPHSHPSIPEGTDEKEIGERERPGFSKRDLHRTQSTVLD